MNLAGVVLAVLGAVVLAGSLAGARHPAIPAAEVRAFRAVNGLPDWLLPVLWLPMQAGNLVVGTLAGLAVAWWVRDWPTAFAVVGAMVLKLVTERVVRRWMEPWLAVRQRPATSQPGAVVRGRDVARTGASFPSGHVILVAAIASVVSTDVPVWVLPVLAALVALVMLGRVYVGAHNPLDVTAGLGVGLLVGGALETFLP